MNAKKQKKRHLSDIFFAILMMVGYYIFTWPIELDILNRIYNQNSILAYNNTMVTYTDEDMEAMFKKMEEYNAGIYEGQQKQTYKYMGPSATDSVYTSLPNSGADIGYLRIPDIGVNVVVSHGTTDVTLQGTAGHLYGTSLPIQGENVHSVIAAHSALSSAKLFTDLNKLKKGQKFYVTVLNQEFEYKIDQIKVVLPEDDYKYEQIEGGKNYVTLYTCTPYGVNTHRLLVRGTLVGQKTVETDDGGLNFTDLSEIIRYSVMFGLVALGPMIATMFYAMYRKHKRKNQRLKKNAALEKQKKGNESDEIIQEKKQE